MGNWCFAASAPAFSWPFVKGSETICEHNVSKDGLVITPRFSETSRTESQSEPPSLTRLLMRSYSAASSAAQLTRVPLKTRRRASTWYLSM